MARNPRLRQQAWSSPWSEQSNWFVPRLARTAPAEPLLTEPWAYNFFVFVLIPLVILRLVGFYYLDHPTRWDIARRYEYAYPGQLLSINPLRRLSIRLTTPWPQYKQGKLGWYRQGLREVAENRRLIEALTTRQERGVVLAAAIANQGNSYQRLLGWEGLERFQVWVGTSIHWPFPEGSWVGAKWGAYFQQYSVGVGQITPAEVAQLGYHIEKIDLFDDAASIRLMQAKLELIRQLAERLNVTPDDAFILMLVGNNNDSGPEIVHNYIKLHSQMDRFLTANPGSRLQLLKMLTYIDYLHTHANWSLPNDVDWAYLWRMARTADTT